MPARGRCGDGSLRGKMPSCWQSSEMEDQIARYRELIVFSAVVVGLLVPCSLKSQFRTQLHRRAQPMAPHDRILRILGGEISALSFLIVEKVAAKRQEVMRGEFLLQKVDDRIFGSRATLLSRKTIRPIGSLLRRDHTAASRYVAFIHVPGFGRHMHRLRSEE